jgi:hypothetical protein
MYSIVAMENAVKTGISGDNIVHLHRFSHNPQPFYYCNCPGNAALGFFITVNLYNQ